MPTAAILYHAPTQSLFKDAYKSAPKNVELYSRKGSEEVLLGSFEFNPLLRNELVISMKKENLQYSDRYVWKIKSNWGNPDWTCIYRLSIRGSE